MRAMSIVFRGKFLAGAQKAYDEGRLEFGGACANIQERAAFVRWMKTLYRNDWVVYAKPPFGGPEQVFNYIGRYTHRVGLSNRRLKSFDETGVCFSTKNGKTVTVSPTEFIRRFLLHVLPKASVNPPLRSALFLERDDQARAGQAEDPPPGRHAAPGIGPGVTQDLASPSSRNDRHRRDHLYSLREAGFGPAPSGQGDGDSVLSHRAD